MATVPPRLLRGQDRRLHVRQTIREDHETRIMDGADDARTEFDELSDSLFSFFRGTCLLFSRDLAGEDGWMPTVLALGDVHPENFGVMPSADNVPIFGVNDFDEAYWAPFTWDVKRGAVGFVLAADVEGGRSGKQQRAIARRFVEGYVDGIEEFGRDSGDVERQVRYDDAPKLIRSLGDLSKKEWKRSASIRGRALAHAHALSDETPDLDDDIESLILEAVGPRDLFVDDILAFALDSVERIRADHEHFRRDHALGAFDTVDRRDR